MNCLTKHSAQTAIITMAMYVISLNGLETHFLEKLSGSLKEFIENTPRISQEESTPANQTMPEPPHAAQQLTQFVNQKTYQEARTASQEHMQEILDYVFATQDAAVLDAFIEAWPEQYELVKKHYVKHLPEESAAQEDYRVKLKPLKDKIRLWTRLIYEEGDPASYLRDLAKELDALPGIKDEHTIKNMRVRGKTLLYEAAIQGKKDVIKELQQKAFSDPVPLGKISPFKEPPQSGTSALLHDMTNATTGALSKDWENVFITLLKYCMRTKQPLVYNVNDSIFQNRNLSEDTKTELAVLLIYALCIEALTLEPKDQSVFEEAQPPNEWRCTECLNDDIENNPIVTLECGHIFHKKCLEKKLTEQQAQRACPQCKSPLPTPVRTHTEIQRLKNNIERFLDHLKQQGVALENLCAKEFYFSPGNNKRTLIYHLTHIHLAYAHDYLPTILSQCAPNSRTKGIQARKNDLIKQRDKKNNDLKEKQERLKEIQQLPEAQKNSNQIKSEKRTLENKSAYLQQRLCTIARKIASLEHIEQKLQKNQ